MRLKRLKRGVKMRDTVYNVGKSIAEEGLPAYRFGGRAFREESERAQDRVEERFADEMGE